jgi:hypothetical protein
MSEGLIIIMSAQYSHRTGVEVSFVRDENKKRRVSQVPLSSSLSLSLSRSLSCSLALQVEADEPTEPRGESVFWTVDLCLATHFFAACLGFRG